MFVEYNPNPTGKRVGDCVVRAICKATGITWDDVYLSLFVEGFEKKDMPSSNDVWGSYLRSLGFDREPIPNTCPDCYRVRDFCLDHPEGAYILVCQSHVVASVDGDYFDTWNSGDEPIYFYWVKE
ncbi:MAG: hypothetical protein IKP68_08060 [Clostridia bacterium]|nr:hypothetical protein [Clostridia bacterium]